MGNRDERPVCVFRHDDCFAYMRSGRCFCLDKTDFKYRKDCPFYKTEDQVEPRIIAEKYKGEDEHPEDFYD